MMMRYEKRKCARLEHPIGECELCHEPLYAGQKVYKFTDENGYYCGECMHSHIMDDDDVEIDS